MVGELGGIAFPCRSTIWPARELYTRLVSNRSNMVEIGGLTVREDEEKQNAEANRNHTLNQEEPAILVSDKFKGWEQPAGGKGNQPLPAGQAMSPVHAAEPIGQDSTNNVGKEFE